MTITNGYSSLAEFKAWVTVRGGTASTDAADDAVMESIIEACSRKIDELTGRKFWKNSVAETRYFQAREAFYLDLEDLVSIATLSVDYANTRTYTDLVAADFELSPPNAALDGKPYTEIFISPTSAAYFPVFDAGGSRSVKISGVFGWPSVPTNIKTDCMTIVHNLWMARSGQVGSGKVSVTAGGIVIRPEDIPDHVMQDILTLRILR